MRSIKRPRRPVHRYRSLLFPGIAVLAVLVFYAAFVPPAGPETLQFEKDGLRLEITGVRQVGGSFVRNFDPDRHIDQPCDTYYLTPGARVAVLEAPPMDGTAPRWELRAAEQEPLGLSEGMDPLEFPEEGRFHVYDLKRRLTAICFDVSSSPDHWK